MALKYRRFISFFVLVFLVIVGGYFYWFRSPSFHAVYPAQALIQDGVRVVVLPLQLDDRYPLVFNIEIESYQYFDLLNLDFFESLILVDHLDQDYNLLKVDVLESEDYRYSCQLTFVNPGRSIDRLTLSFFGLTEMIFNWKL